MKPEVTVHAWSTEPLEGIVIEVVFFEPNLSKEDMLSFSWTRSSPVGELSARPSFSTNGRLLGFGVTVSLASLRLLDFLAEFWLAKALVLALSLCKKGQKK